MTLYQAPTEVVHAMSKILCIEDDADIREDIVEELQDAHYEVLEAGSGSEGLEMILKHKPDLVLCDINMPSKTVTHCCKRFVKSTSCSPKCRSYS